MSIEIGKNSVQSLATQLVFFPLSGVEFENRLVVHQCLTLVKEFGLIFGQVVLGGIVQFRPNVLGSSTSGRLGIFVRENPVDSAANISSRPFWMSDQISSLFCAPWPPLGLTCGLDIPPLGLGIVQTIKESEKIT